jgi:hypothetical protein
VLPLLVAASLLVQEEPRSRAPADRLTFVHYAPGPEPVRDVAALGRAGFDVALVRWREGLDLAPLVAALEIVARSGAEPPLLAPAVDVAPGADPASAAGSAIRAFDGAVPARRRAHVDGRPLLWLLPAPPGAAPPDLSAFRPWLVADASWAGLAADRAVRHGAGPRDDGVISVPGGGDDAAHEKAWFAALRLESPWVAVESWEAIVAQPERGKQRLESLDRLLRKFKLREKNALPKGKWTGAAKALFTMKYNPREQGLRPVPAADGAFDAVQLRGLAVLASKENPLGPRRTLGFDVDDSFHYHERRSFELTVEFLDLGEGTFRVEYDSADRKLPLPERERRPAGEGRFEGTGEWKEARFDLPDALFGNHLEGGADLRLVLDGRGIVVRRVALLPR